MKTLIVTAFALITGFAQVTLAQEALIQKTLAIKTTQFASVMSRTENNIKLFVDNFDLKLDKGAKLTSPKEVSGTILQPVLKFSVKKCVLIICQKINFDAEFTLQKVAGACDANYILVGDLRRSSEALANNYTNMNTSLCIRKTVDGATAAITVTLIKAATFEGSTVQKEIAKFVKTQADSVVQSFSRVMLINGATEVTAL